MGLLLAGLLIFGMRLLDVSAGTLRIVMLVRGKRRWAGILGFLESLIWVLAARQVLGNLDEPIKIVAYAGGFAAGTMLGSTIERWLAMGSVLVRVVAPVDSPHAYQAVREAGHPVTVLNGEGRDGPVRLWLCVTARRDVGQVLDLIARENPQAFVTVEEARLPDLSTRRSAASVRK
jgi:uncharacterized protein YebE (UPF0316 family)